MIELTLARRGNRLADPAEQVRLLAGTDELPTFDDALAQAGAPPLHARGIEVLQVNVGKLCNQTCRHCHVDAGPDRRETMSSEVATACLDVLSRAEIPTLDITGGAPEMNPQFRRLVVEARRMGRRVIDRCNLTIVVAPGYEDLALFLAENRVEIVASLPCYLEENVDRQRGDRAFARSIAALKQLNALGYGLPDSSLSLTLVYNPQGAALPPPQEKLEADYRRELRRRHGVEFTKLITITNMPISRFLDDLLQSERYFSYLSTLVDAFNPATLADLMCRTTLSVDWLGNLYDCDFNQMLGLEIAAPHPRNVLQLDDGAMASLRRRPVVTGRHCFGCTAGAGSGCAGQILG